MSLYYKKRIKKTKIIHIQVISIYLSTCNFISFIFIQINQSKECEKQNCEKERANQLRNIPVVVELIC